MKDTSEDMEKKQREMIMSKSNEERFLMGLEMIDDGRQLMIAGIKMKNPDISEDEIRIEILKRYRRCDDSLYWLDYLGLW